jgi:hypothetical protein
MFKGFLCLALAAPKRCQSNSYKKVDQRFPKNATNFGDHPSISSVEGDV